MARGPVGHVRPVLCHPQEPVTYRIHGRNSSCGSWCVVIQHCRKRAAGTSLCVCPCRCRSSIRTQQHRPKTMRPQHRHLLPSSSQPLQARFGHSVCTARTRMPEPWQVFLVRWKPMPSELLHALSTIRQHSQHHAGVCGRHQAVVPVFHGPGGCTRGFLDSYKLRQRCE